MRGLTSIILGVRILIALLTRTFFQPDEYFQALEPAHHIVYGYGHLTWEWMSDPPIRSILYPALNVPIYWALKITGLDSCVVGQVLLLLQAFTDSRSSHPKFYMEPLQQSQIYSSAF